MPASTDAGEAALIIERDLAERCDCDLVWASAHVQAVMVEAVRRLRVESGGSSTDSREVEAPRDCYSCGCGLFRWYTDYELPASLGGGLVTVRLHGNDEDKKRRFNLTENVRPIPASDPDFARLYPRRNDVESINRALDDSMLAARAHSVGHARQHLNLLGYAVVVNSVALHEHRRRKAHTPLAA